MRILILSLSQWLFFLMLLSSGSAYAEIFQSEVKQTSLVELYSSEGCSSCPPADFWIGTLRSRPGLWKEFVPITFHVGYWDYLGWKDEFAKEEYVARQNRYAFFWKSSSVYTPAVVVNGQASNAWRYGELPTASTQTPGILKLEIEKTGKGTVAFFPQDKNQEYVASVAILGFDIQSDVQSGENRGRLLSHQFLSLAHQSFPLSSRQNFEHSFQIPIPSHVKNIGVAGWIELAGKPVPIQATGGVLAADPQE